MENEEDYILIFNQTTVAMKSAFGDFLRAHEPKGMQAECIQLLLCILLVLCTLAVFVKIVGPDRNLKFAISACFMMTLLNAVNLIWRYRPQCTDKKDCGLDKNFVESWNCERTPFNTIMAIAGLLFSGCLSIELLQYCKKAKGMLDLVAGPMCYCMGGVVFTDAPMKLVLLCHMPMLVMCGIVCLATLQPVFICTLECLSTYTAFAFNVVYLLCWYAGIGSVVYGIFQMYMLYDARNGSKDTLATTIATSKTAGDLRNVFQMLPASTSAAGPKIVDQNSVLTMPRIPLVKVKDTVNKDTDKFEGYKNYSRLWSFFCRTCTIDGKDPDDKDIKAIFEANNFLCDDKAKAKYLTKELAHLGLIDPKKKKK